MGGAAGVGRKRYEAFAHLPRGGVESDGRQAQQRPEILVVVRLMG